MKSHELKVTAERSARRSGRGIAAGHGKTAGRGTKGQNARSGGKRRPGFEGGQNPLYMRLPKLKGFRSHKTKPVAITSAQLVAIGKKSVDHQILYEAGLIPNIHTSVKLVLNGEISGSINAKADAASEGVIAALKKAGGSFTPIAAPQRTATEKKK